MDSLSSALTWGTTAYRNQAGIMNKIVAQFGYALSAAVSVIETIVAAIFTAISALLYVFSPYCLEFSKKWLGSAAFTIVWSTTDFFMNLFVVSLASKEQDARKVIKSGNLLQIPKS